MLWVLTFVYLNVIIHSVFVRTYNLAMKLAPEGKHAAFVQDKKASSLKKVRLPKDALPGSLAMTRRKCGTKTCHCAKGEGHPQWMLTFMEDGKKRVERVPEEWVDYVRQRLEEAKRFKENVNQVLLANAELLVLLRKQKQRT